MSGGLKRRLGRTDALAIALGGVIGVGVFRTTGTVLVGAGGVGAATALWIVAGVVCMAGALVYGDLASRVPDAGGPYAYVREGFGRVPAFAYGWLNAGISIPARQASVMAVIGEVINGFFPTIHARWFAIGILVALTLLNLGGVHAGAIAQRIFTTGKVGTILLVIGLAVWALTRPATTAFADASPAVGAATFAAAVAGVWYSYLGWQDLVLLAEEVHDPRKDLPWVLVVTVGSTIVLYSMLHIAVYVGLGDATSATVMPVKILAARTLGLGGVTLLSLLMLSSMVGGAAEGIMVRPRMALALARDGFGPKFLTRVSENGTPWAALVSNSGLVLVLLLTGTFAELLPLMTFTQGILGLVECASYFAVRRRRPTLPTMRFHPWGPLLFVAANLALFVIEGLHDPWRAGISVGVLALATVTYVVIGRT